MNKDELIETQHSDFGIVYVYRRRWLGFIPRKWYVVTVLMHKVYCHGEGWSRASALADLAETVMKVLA